MEVYLVRHTDTVCEKGVCYGQSDVGILKPYDVIFEVIQKQLPEDAILYSSPLQRCVLLANYIKENSVITSINEDSRLLEMNFGDWEMKNWDVIPPNDFTPWMNDFVNVRVPNGESFTDLHDRVFDFMENELLKNSSKPVIIVAHAGVIRSVLCRITNLPLKDAFQNKVDFGAVIKIEL
ncbi:MULTISPECIES: alpha-ribazole phosphatase [Flavobacterium]|uniref:Alpha-ribazole phosphatase n=1 Tax=Flavobacterium gawalongense TaxID=2594432 RepID=A0A553BDZ9_9FLAO|nr:alpha-ribazole phosphatase [Flavobacterium gawalongense]TRW98902.1 alpha-ribazole phosphatase [Flavobacterium gawalongense]TRX03513.1 alpha-ribazole phosphatase [Flavobacterium gawalongense]TRX06476.1 alpha-ribazole phosphatase [Flavobacterium gawalongense]TRX07301.1 alpha-ribazole phosphatase [Flavobacterium gawalongense]TRX24995.1 alpha-ribazole phosphatase [Flavobacterium gawalongense]